ncbi:PilW family protein [Kineococcus radiotolerans]|uniref:PilW family protein n=1 Tax=Kineococcus radiotolerans TaxID=131568 RepID=UPI0023B16E4F|nr:prepilin-type N-terminal cleavage/methylation domain-containing protein [Kineococcus radiotolerans]
MRVWQRRDAGITLVELLVGMSITGLVLAMLAAVTIGSMRSTSKVSSKNDVNNDARTAVSTMTQALRVAQPILLVDGGGNPVKINGRSVNQALEVATSASLTFYASMAASVPSPAIAADPPPTRVTYAYNTSRRCLAETTVPGTPAMNAANQRYYRFTAAPTTRCLAFGTVNVDGSALFSYSTLPEATASMTAQYASPTAVSAAGAGIAAAQLASVRQVNIHLVLSAVSGAASSTTGVNSSVTLVNTLAKGSR